MPIPELRAPLAFAGDKPGPFAGGAGRDLRVLVDLPASQRQADDSTTSPGRLGIPEPSRLLWSLGQRDDITLHWLADPGQDGQPGAVCLDELAPRSGLIQQLGGGSGAVGTGGLQPLGVAAGCRGHAGRGRDARRRAGHFQSAAG